MSDPTYTCVLSSPAGEVPLQYNVDYEGRFEVLKRARKFHFKTKGKVNYAELYAEYESARIHFVRQSD